jgi:hypothetical protein
MRKAWAQSAELHATQRGNVLTYSLASSKSSLMVDTIVNSIDAAPRIGHEHLQNVRSIVGSKCWRKDSRCSSFQRPRARMSHGEARGLVLAPVQLLAVARAVGHLAAAAALQQSHGIAGGAAARASTGDYRRVRR